MDLGLRGKTVLVAGGARGLGLDMARAFAAEGCRIAISDLNVAGLVEAKASLTASGAECVVLPADLFKAEGCQRVVDEAAAAFGGLDVLVNNTSTDVSKYPARLEEVTDEQLLERVMGKAMAAVRCSRAAMPHLRRSGTGRIVSIGGDAARTTSNPFSDGAPGSGLAAGLGNAMLVNFTKRLSNEAAKDSILVNVVHPGAALKGYRYDLRVQRLADERGVTPAEAEAELVRRIPLRRGIESMDIAPLVVYLCSPLNGAITGQSIAVDGGSNPGVIY